MTAHDDQKTAPLAPSLIRDIPFPLNVYAFLTCYNSGQFRELHYGLFDDADDSLEKAQGNSTELLLRHLPLPPHTILEVGVGFGHTFKTLTEKGFTCTGISPDQTQIRITRSNTRDENLFCTGFEEMTEKSLFETIIFQESSQYIKPDDLFQKSNRLLVPDGRILLVDEFSTGGERLHNMTNFLSVAESNGFQLQNFTDLSRQAAPTVDYILENLTAFHHSLLQDLPVTPEQLEELSRALQLYRQNYSNGTFRYCFFEFRKGSEAIS